MKKIICYSILLTVVLFAVVSTLNAENEVTTVDYNLSLKAYKIDTPINYIEKYNAGEIDEELKENATIYPGDIIAVGVYVTTYNPVGRIFHITLDWNKDILEQIIYDENLEGVTDYTLLPFIEFSYGDLYCANCKEEFDYNSSYDTYLTSFSEGYNTKIENIIDTFYLSFKKARTKKTTLSSNGIMYWYFFKVNEEAKVDYKCNLTFQNAIGYNEETKKIDIVTNPLTLNIGRKDNYRPYGDLNNDGRVDLVDYELYGDVLSKQYELSEEDFKYADITFDGKINISDKAKLSSYLEGVVKRLNPEEN